VPISVLSQRQARQLGHLLQGLLLVLLLAVAYATPREQLYLGGLQDGGDYDSLVQPLVLALAGLPATAVPVLSLLGPSPAPAILSVLADRPVLTPRAADPRAPPVL